MGTRTCAAIVLAVLLVAACSDGSGEREVAVNEAQTDGGGWTVFAAQANADEVEGFASLAEMGKIADVVVVAQATGVDGVRRVGGAGPEGSDLAQVRFEVVRAISDWDADSVVVEFDMATSLEALERQVAAFPPAVLALREKGTKEEAGFYRLVSSKSLWTEQPGGGVVAPLAEYGEAPDFASETAEIEGLEDLGDHLEAARRDCDGECGLSQAAWNR